MADMNDKEYWDERFDKDWVEKRGRDQSRFFARLALELMPDWLKWTLADSSLTMLDWGCALGDGTDTLSQGLAGVRITGCDFSSSAITDAAQRYAPLEFACFDIMRTNVKDRWDFVFSSNTLEHFRQPWLVLSRLAPLASQGLILLIPYEEYLRIDEHFYTFESSNIPFQLAGEFVLTYSRVIDGANIPAAEWAGKQILLVYLRKDAALLGQLRLDSVVSPSPIRPTAEAVTQDELTQKLLDERRSMVQQQLRIAELEGRVQYEQSVALERNGERDLLLAEIEELHHLHLQRRYEWAHRPGEAEAAGSPHVSDNEPVSLEEAAKDVPVTAAVAADSSSETFMADADAGQEQTQEQMDDEQQEKEGGEQQMQERQEQQELQEESDLIKVELTDDTLEANVGEEEKALPDPALTTLLDEKLKLERQHARIQRDMRALERRVQRMQAQMDSRTDHQSRSAMRQVAAVASGMSTYLSDLSHQRRQLADALAEVKQSNSWKLTGPIRKLVSALRGNGPTPEVDYAVSEDARHAHFLRELEQVKQDLYNFVPAEAGARKIFIFTGVPYDDIGGGQRAAQLARVLLERGEHVTYVYAYRKWENGEAVESSFTAPRLQHLFLERTSLDELTGSIGADDVAIFELPHNGFIEYFERFGSAGARRVFELIDAWDSSLGGDWFSTEVMDRYIAESEVVVGTAKVLRDKLVAAGRADALYLPNAANDRIFDSYKTYPRPHEFESGKRALLYFGSLYGEWFDWECIDAAARAGAATTNIYLIGDPPAGRQVQPNVHFLGSRQIDELPAYLRHCDAALLPFIPGHISDAVSPIKVFEYLAMGVPVIANALPELEGYPNVLIAGDVQEFARLCVSDLQADAEQVDGFLMANSWASRADAIVPARDFGRVVSAIVLIHNNARIIERCLRSLQMHGAAYLADIVVVDNASTDGGAELVESLFPDVKVVRNEKNGCSSGRNLGAAVASGSVLAFFDSDQWITSRGCFEEALQVLECNQEIGAVGWAAGWFSGGGEHLGGPIADYLPLRGTDTEEYRQLGFRTDIAYLGSGGFFTPRAVFAKVGGFDEYYDPTCFEDTDLSFGVLNQGYSLAFRDLQGIRHQPHQTTSASAGSDAYSRLFLRNSKYFESKWKGRPQFFFDVPVRA